MPDGSAVGSSSRRPGRARPTVRALGKRLAEALLTGAGVERLALRRHRARTLVLAYHNVVPAGERPCGDRSLHLPQAAFAAQLDALAATHEVVSLAAFDQAPRGDRPRAVITIDDAYRGAVTAGVGELVARGLPATVFVAPGLFGTSTWWDRLAEPAGGAVPPAVRAAALAAHQGRGPSVMAAFGLGAMSLPEWAGIASEEEVRAAATAPGITLGAHTWSHANLAALEPEDLAAELERPLRWLRGLGARAVPWLAYPYGLTSANVAKATASNGYAGAFRIEGGWIPVDAGELARRHEFPRYNVPSGLSLRGFRLRSAGLL